MEKMREEFEEAVAVGDVCNGFRHITCGYTQFISTIESLRSGNGYSDPVIDEAYKVWKCSRRSMIVDLPSGWSDDSVAYRQDIIEQLDDAGVSYK